VYKKVMPPRRRPTTTDPGELLLFVTEPQQLDAVFEYGTETLTPSSIRVPASRRRCSSCPKAARPGRFECNEHDDDEPYGQPIDRDPLTPGGLFGDLPTAREA
jgi:hypothetical protein